MDDPNKVSYFGETDARNRRLRFGIKEKDRSRHMYIIGKTGMGKSTLLENLAIQDIQDGHGIAFLDPHGKTADLLLEYVPENRLNDVIYFAPFDMDFPVSFNVMEDVGPDKRHLVSNGLMSAFKKIWVDAWSARMEYILNNILLALLEYPGSTLIGVNRMLADEVYRAKVVANVTDPSVKAFWTEEFAKYGPKYMQEAGAAIQNKIGQFISNPLVRNIIGQPKSTFDIRKIMDEGKILIINLSKGRVGEANANLLGAMLITKIYLGALSRADVHEDELQKLPNFFLYVDEFQNFANESFAGILSEARKYKLNLIIAHQYIEQMTDEVRAAVFGNVGTMIVFRVGAYDAEVLEKEFTPQFTIDDLVNLGFTQVYLKLMIDGVTSRPFSATTLPPVARPEKTFRNELIELTRKNFARPRADVEEEIMRWHAGSQSSDGEVREGRGERSSFEQRGPSRGEGRGEYKGENRGERPKTSFNKGKSAIESALEAVLGKPSSLKVSQNKPTVSEARPNYQNTERQTGKVDPALEREKELRKAVSLSYLRQTHQRQKEKKAPSEEHLTDLRNALAAVTGDIIKEEIKSEVKEEVKTNTAINTQNISTPPKTESIATVETKKEFTSEHRKTDSGESHRTSTEKHTNTNFSIPTKEATPREVPEDVLKRILEI